MPDGVDSQSRVAAECIGVVAVAVVTRWALSHLVMVCGSEVGEEVALLGVGLDLHAGLALIFN